MKSQQDKTHKSETWIDVSAQIELLQLNYGY